MEILAKPNTNLSEDWMILVFLVMLAIVALIRTRYPLHFRQLINSFLSDRLMRQLMREETSTKRESLLFFLNFFLSIGMMLYLTHRVYSWFEFSFPGFVLFLVYVLAVLAFYALKSLVIHTVRFLSDGNYGLDEYHYILFFMNRISGLFLFPLTVLAAYLDRDIAPWVLLAGWVVFGFFVVFGLLRGILGALKMGVEVFYIFFYICTLEFLPLLLLFKLLTR